MLALARIRCLVVQIKALQKDDLLPSDGWWFDQTARFGGRGRFLSGPLKRLQGYLAHKKVPLPYDRPRALGIGLL